MVVTCLVWMRFWLCNIEAMLKMVAHILLCQGWIIGLRGVESKAPCHSRKVYWEFQFIGLGFWLRRHICYNPIYKEQAIQISWALKQIPEDPIVWWQQSGKSYILAKILAMVCLSPMIVHETHTHGVTCYLYVSTSRKQILFVCEVRKPEVLWRC